MKKKIFLISVMALALISIFAISVFADELIASKTVSEEYGTVIQLKADPGLDNAKQYVSTLNKINDSGTDKDALCILTDGTYFYVFPSSYIVNEKADGQFDIYAGTDANPGLVQAISEFNVANETEYYSNYTLNGSGGGKKIDAVVRFEFPSDVKYAHQDYCCMRKYPKLIEVRINHPIDFSSAEKMFDSNGALTTVIGLENATGLAKNMFMFCRYLKSVNIPTDTVKIPDGMFFCCGVNASGVFTILNLADCTQLTTIGADAFRDSTKIHIPVPDSVTTIGDRAFQSCKNGTVVINETSRLQVIGESAFYSCQTLTTLYIPSTVTSIGKNAFNSCMSLKSVENFENCQITTIQSSVFEGATSLKSIKIPETVTTIENAFLGNKSLTKVYIPKRVTSIADTFLDLSWANYSSNTVFIYTGNDASVLAECLRLKNANIIPASQYDETKSYTGINLVVGYSHCVAYYNGVHSSTVIDDIVTSYYETIDLVSRCVECGVTEDAGQIPAFFICLGYSTPEDGRNGIAICFRVNNKAISLYKDATGKDVEYGIFAVAQSKLGKNDIFNNNGSKAEGVIDINISDRSLVEYDFILTGFTDANKDAKLAIGTYIAVTKGETTEYSYMQADKPCENEKYHFISYSDIVTSTLSEN